MLRSTPHLVRPQPLIAPALPGLLGKSPALRAMWRHARLAGRSTLPPPRLLSPDEARLAYPGLRREGLRGGVMFFDAVASETRLALANVCAAREAGARVASYLEPVGADERGVRLVDRRSGAEVALSVREILHVPGGDRDAVRRALGVETEQVVGFDRRRHLVLPPRPGEVGLAAFLPDGSVSVVTPVEGGTLCGVDDREAPDGGEAAGPTVEDLDRLWEIASLLFDPEPARADVLGAFAGRHVVSVREAQEKRRTAGVHTERIACGRLHTVPGGAAALHRASAEKVLGELFGFSEPSPTRKIPLPGGEGPREVSDPLWWRYGSRSLDVRRLIRAEPELGRRLCPHRPFLAAEIVHALRNEGAETFTDVMLRRFDHPAGPCLDEDCLEQAHTWFRRERPDDADGERDSALALLRREVEVRRGALVLWRDHAATVTPSSS